jgi:hypothetical protein
MKIYIDEYDPLNLKNKLNVLDHYFLKSSNYIEIYSDNGIYHINNNYIYKTVIVQDNIEYKQLNNIKFIIDKSKYTKQIINNIPLNHINFTIYKFEYCINEKSKIKFIIEGNYDYIDYEKIINDKYHLFTPSNFYFEIDEIDNHNIFSNNDINVFLSLLN